MYIVLFEPTKSQPTPGHIGFQQLWQIADDIKNNLDEAKLLQAAGEPSRLVKQPEKKPMSLLFGGIVDVGEWNQGETSEKMRKRGVAFPFKVGAVVCLFLSEEDLEKT